MTQNIDVIVPSLMADILTILEFHGYPDIGVTLVVVIPPSKVTVASNLNREGVCLMAQKLIDDIGDDEGVKHVPKH